MVRAGKILLNRLTVDEVIRVVLQLMKHPKYCQDAPVRADGDGRVVDAWGGVVGVSEVVPGREERKRHATGTRQGLAGRPAASKVLKYVVPAL